MERDAKDDIDPEYLLQRRIRFEGFYQMMFYC